MAIPTNSIGEAAEIFSLNDEKRIQSAPFKSEKELELTGVSPWFTRTATKRCWGDTMAAETTSLQELLVSSLAQTDALAKLLIEKSIITEEEFLAKISEERETYQRMLHPTKQ